METGKGVTQTAKHPQLAQSSWCELLTEILHRVEILITSADQAL